MIRIPLNECVCFQSSHSLEQELLHKGWYEVLRSGGISRDREAFYRLIAPTFCSAVGFLRVLRFQGEEFHEEAFSMLLSLLGTFVAIAGLGVPQEPVSRQESAQGITHAVLATGADTFLLSAENKVVWTYPRNTRDGWVLPNGHILLIITRSNEFPGGGVVEVDQAGKTYFEYKGTQSEIATAQPLPKGNILINESGDKPRLLEVDRSGKILKEIPLQCQTKDHHMQTRMARKLKNGNYLVPHPLDLAVKEYTPEGKVVWEVHTSDWPFAVIREENGNTLISCTRGNMIIEVDKEGKQIWQVTNADLPGAPIHDACGASLLPNGHIVFTNYGAGGKDAIKLVEITREKQIVWKLYSGRDHGIHEFHILGSNLLPLRGKSLR